MYAKINLIIISVLFSFTILFSQGMYYEFEDDTIVGELPVPPGYKISSIDLTGSMDVMVMVIGFPDLSNNWPVLENNSTNYPKLGAFPDGTLLSDYIASNGPVPIEDWFGASFERFFEVHSSGLFTADAYFPKDINGKTYTTDYDLQYWINKNGSENNVCFNYWDEMAFQVANKIYSDDPAAFTNIDMVQITFTGIEKHQFHVSYYGVAYLSDKSFHNPDNPSEIFSEFTGPVAVLRAAGALEHEALHIFGKTVGSPSGFTGLPDRGHDKLLGSGSGTSRHFNAVVNFDVMYHNGRVAAQYSLYSTSPMLSHDLIALGWVQSDEILEINDMNISNLKLADINYPLTTQQKSEGFYRVVKVMIHENYEGDKDEYFLIEYHNATEFDKNFSNYDEGLYNTGILIWHVKEDQTMVNVR